jgi:hypothetical protein
MRGDHRYSKPKRSAKKQKAETEHQIRKRSGMDIAAYLLTALATILFAICSGIYSSHRIPSIVVFGIGVLVTDAAGCLFWVSKTTPVPNGPAPATSGFIRPLFRNKDKSLLINLGGTRMWTSPAKIRAGSRFVNLAGFEPIKLTEKDGVIKVSVFSDGDKPAIELDGGDFLVHNPRWDKNFDDSALEVVDENAIPVFQFIYLDEKQVVIKGIFRKGGRVLVAHDLGFALDPRSPVPITRIFEYPSASNPGKRRLHSN